jgi:hypothetical protein
MVKPNAIYFWNDELRDLFETCKKKIIDQVHEGVKNYSMDRLTCLQTDFSKEGLGYLLLQKYCGCPIEMAPICCQTGWKLVFAGSRFTKGAEMRYSPTEGEALAVAWALNHAHIFTKGCPKLIISTDHLPLLGILNDKPLENIKNPRLVRLKEQTLSFQFIVKYNKGKWHRAPDALSRNPQPKLFALDKYSLIPQENLQSELVSGNDAELALSELSSEQSLTVEDVRKSTEADSELKLLASAVQNGFEKTHHLTSPSIRQYFNAKNEIWIQNGILMYKHRIIIPSILRKNILNSLHSAHQGVEGMRARAAMTVYWPGLNTSIKQTRDNCTLCNKISPSNAREPLQIMSLPHFPFQQICMDGFEIGGHQYLAIVDKFSGWIIIFHTRNHPSSKHIVNSLRSTFSTYGAPEILFTDGGLPFQSQELQTFLQNWKVHHVTSSAFYAQGNGRAELAVKTAKRLLHENTAIDGSLNSDNACRALLQYRNTPIKHIGMSPAQLLYHRSLRDGVPMDSQALRPSKVWIEAAKKREDALSRRNSEMIERYDRTAHPLPIIPVGANVLIQTPPDTKWSKSGVVVEVYDRKYIIRMDGSGRVVSRNRRFVKPLHCTSPEVSDAGLTLSQSVPITPMTTKRIPRMLKNLLPHNKSGLNELNSE